MFIKKGLITEEAALGTSFIQKKEAGFFPSFLFSAPFLLTLFQMCTREPFVDTFWPHKVQIHQQDQIGAHLNNWLIPVTSLPLIFQLLDQKLSFPSLSLP